MKGRVLSEMRALPSGKDNEVGLHVFIRVERNSECNSSNQLILRFCLIPNAIRHSDGYPPFRSQFPLLHPEKDSPPKTQKKGALITDFSELPSDPSLQEGVCISFLIYNRERSSVQRVWRIRHDLGVTVGHSNILSITRSLRHFNELDSTRC
jgi:hypothetical protein